MIYIAAWCFCLVMLLCSVRFPDHARWHCTLAVCVVGVVAIFRGATGTDTVAYEQLSMQVRESGIFTVGVEPFFGLLLKALQQTGLADTGVVRLVSGLEVALLLAYVWRSVPNEQYLLLSVILPVFFYEFSMNALRIGLASILFLCAMQWVARQRQLGTTSLALAVASCVTHYTAVLYPVFLVSTLRRWSFRFLLGGAILCGLAVIAVILMNSAYLISRLHSYSAFPAPSRFSGLASIVQNAAVSMAIWKSTLSHGQKLRLLSAMWLVAACFFGVVQFSYAGLRLLELVVFIAPLATVYAHEIEGKLMNASARIWLFAFGLVSMVFVFRRFLVESPDSLAPFLPYRLIFS
ncbi:MAG: EpsG family protein [Castellaniella sp.]|uniref:EpsG family protein n=1 Tax=Castellaniella sp. TaxID=1955812 RepID=UPI002A3594CB|nr:EpsG family protein [Castellaniella sp.]MDY0309057.1 EpsG family protein [Castellaniella sp.]